MIMLAFVIALIALIGFSIYLGNLLRGGAEWIDVLLLSFLIVLCSSAITILAYKFKNPNANPVITQSSPVNWGTVDSTLTIGTNRFEVEVGVHYDGTIQYRKGKAK